MPYRGPLNNLSFRALRSRDQRRERRGICCSLWPPQPVWSGHSCPLPLTLILTLLPLAGCQWEGMTGKGTTFSRAECRHHRGRAALQRRVSITNRIGLQPPTPRRLDLWTKRAERIITPQPGVRHRKAPACPCDGRTLRARHKKESVRGQRMRTRNFDAAMGQQLSSGHSRL